MILSEKLELLLTNFYKSHSYEKITNKFWDSEELYGTITLSSNFHIWVYKTSKNGLEFVYLHKISRMSNQAIALPIEWVASNGFELTSFLSIHSDDEIHWVNDYFSKRLFLTQYVLKPTYTIEIHRTSWKKYEYIFLYKYNTITQQGLAIPVQSVPQISRYIHSIISGKKMMFNVGDKIKSNKGRAVGVGTVMKLYEDNGELMAKFEDGTWIRLGFYDCEKVNK